jgi:CRP/FNR family transcriptional regulator
MAFRQKVRLLSLVDVLEPLSRESLERFARRTPTMHLRSGQIFHTPARRGGPFLLLLEGRVRLYKLPAGKELTLAIVDAGALSGEGTFAAQQLQGVYARTLEPSTAAIVSPDQLRRLIGEEPEVGMKLVEALSGRLSAYADRMADLGRKSVRGRVAGLILGLVQSEGVVGRDGYRIPTPYTHAELADMVGAGRVAVTNALLALREEGCIEIRDRYVHVGEVKALERISGQG